MRLPCEHDTDILHVQVDNPEDMHAPPVRVHASEHAIGRSYLLSALAPPTQILQLDPSRRRAVIKVNDNPPTSSNSSPGTIAAPGAGAVLASVSLPPGTYLVHWLVDLTGTLGAAENDNVQLMLGATVLMIGELRGAAGTYAQIDSQVVVPAGPNQTLQVQTIGAGTAGSQYTVQLDAIPQIIGTGNQCVICHSEGQASSVMTGAALLDEGMLVTVGDVIVVETSAALWAVPLAGAAIRVGVLTEKS